MIATQSVTVIVQSLSCEYLRFGNGQLQFDIGKMERVRHCN